MGTVQIKGVDAAKFLQGQITQDVLSLSEGQQRLSACCNPQGRMRAIFRVIKTVDGFFLVMPRSIIAGFIDALKKYAAFFKVELKDSSDEWTVSGRYRIENDHVLTATLDAISVALDDHRYLQLCRQPSSEPIAMDEARWLALDIIHRQAWVWPETVEQLLAHEVGLKEANGISFEKGCYTGQEIVARMEYRGKLKSTVAIAFCASTEIVPAATEVVAGDQSVGTVISAARHPIAGQLLLINVQQSALENPITLNLPSRSILQVLT